MSEGLELAKTVLDYVIVSQENARCWAVGRDPGAEREDRSDALFTKMVALARAIQYPTTPSKGAASDV